MPPFARGNTSGGVGVPISISGRAGTARERYVGSCIVFAHEARIGLSGASTNVGEEKNDESKSKSQPEARPATARRAAGWPAKARPAAARWWPAQPLTWWKTRLKSPAARRGFS